MSISATNVTVNFVNSSGNTVATASRPLRVLPDGKGFGVVRKGKVLPFVATSANEGTAIVGTNNSFPVDQCRAAKMADLGLKTKVEVKAEQPSAPRTVAQQQATVNMLRMKLAKKTSPQVKKALATAEHNLARLQSSKPAKDYASMTKAELINLLAS